MQSVLFWSLKYSSLHCLLPRVHGRKSACYKCTKYNTEPSSCSEIFKFVFWCSENADLPLPQITRWLPVADTPYFKNDMYYNKSLQHIFDARSAHIYCLMRQVNHLQTNSGLWTFHAIIDKAGMSYNSLEFLQNKFLGQIKEIRIVAIIVHKQSYWCNNLE